MAVFFVPRVFTSLLQFQSDLSLQSGRMEPALVADAAETLYRMTLKQQGAPVLGRADLVPPDIHLGRDVKITIGSGGFKINPETADALARLSALISGGEEASRPAGTGPPSFQTESLRGALKRIVEEMAATYFVAYHERNTEMEGRIQSVAKELKKIAEEVVQFLMVEEAIKVLIPYLSRVGREDSLGKSAAIVVERIGKRVLPFLEGVWPVAKRGDTPELNALRSRLLKLFIAFGEDGIPYMTKLLQSDPLSSKRLTAAIRAAR